MSYSDENCARISEAADRRERSCTIIVDKVLFTVDFKNMVQRRAEVSVGTARPRQAMASCYSVRGPEQCNDRTRCWKRRIREMQPSWDSQEENVKVCCVDEQTVDYEKAANKLYESYGGLSKEVYAICRVMRVQNLEAFKRYMNDQESITERRGGGQCLD